jgi:succinoglycan biosynthesis protein ExoA
VWGGFYKRSVFDRNGLFDESLVRNQDDELNLRLVHAGGVIWQSPLIRSWYQVRGSLRALFRQYRQYGYWKVRVILKHRLLASPRHLVPSGLVVLLVTQLTATIALQLAALGNPHLLAPASLVLVSLLFVLAAYAAATLAAAVATASAFGWDLLPVLPIVFPLYHAGYGIGFIAGLRDAALRRRRAPNWAGVLTR